jgi:uncharacterized protein (DUF1778 family)
MRSALKADRLEARIEPEDKRFIERAADLSGRTMTDFIVEAAVTKAREIIQQYEAMVLTDPQDRAAFFAAMMRAPTPSDRLRAAAARYRDSTKDHV